LLGTNSPDASTEPTRPRNPNGATKHPQPSGKCPPSRGRTGNRESWRTPGRSVVRPQRCSIRMTTGVSAVPWPSYLDVSRRGHHGASSSRVLRDSLAGCLKFAARPAGTLPRRRPRMHQRFAEVDRCRAAAGPHTPAASPLSIAPWCCCSGRHDCATESTLAGSRIAIATPGTGAADQRIDVCKIATSAAQPTPSRDLCARGTVR